jgi:putative ABC transport system substrate-binding protein
MKRRTFIAGLGSAAAWPVVVRAQQGERMRRIGVLMPVEAHDPYFQGGLSVFVEALSDAGWVDGRNLRIDTRWAAGSIDRARIFAKELVALQPDAIYAISAGMAVALQRETLTIPIVFMGIPASRGLVVDLARPNDFLHQAFVG